ncbi:MAG: tRNA pseudouridine(38-40) synthase TruA [Lachnospiraceae bacterium]|jgi:tRNA pseudouridine38-40 synthase|nr:tRNA pseudouridine(38-40) synthase TruA [Lachnospiraceae bacterium]
MINYRLFVEYEGTRYDGWQRQGNTDRTIQGKLEAVLGRLFAQEIQVQGSGRTDAGVHAAAQVANFHVPNGARWLLPEAERAAESEERALEKYLNRYLPEDIGVYGLERAHERFHSRYQAVGKTYRYRIWTREEKPVFLRRYVWQLPGRLDMAAMRQAARYVTGTWDFASFCGNTRGKKSTVRTIDRLEVEEEAGLVTICVHGDGFLQNMVRILTGTLAEIGQGMRDPEEMKGILAAKRRPAAGMTAPPQGLCLESVDYDPPFLPPEGAVRRDLRQKDTRMDFR